MPQRLNQIFDIEAKDLYDTGVFNGFVDIDSKFHVDPALLQSTTIPEFANSKDLYDKHFIKIIKLLTASKKEGDLFFLEAAKLLTFKETKAVSLGYSIGGNHGNGVGPKIAKGLAKTAKLIIDAGNNDPDIFDLVGLFQSGYGLDRVSDMTISIIIDDLAAFSKRVSSELNIKISNFDINGIDYELPFNPITKKPIIFIPRELIRTIPIAKSWDDFDTIKAYSDSVKEKTNSRIGKTWKKATSSSVQKKTLREELIDNPTLVTELLEKYKSKDRIAYDFEVDKDGLKILRDLVEKAINDHPYDLSGVRPVTEQSIHKVVLLICNQLKQLIEYNGWNAFLYDQKEKLMHESYPQKLFYGIADIYSQVNDLDLTAESNAGRGSLDFKLSVGASKKVSVEMKYDSNTNLIHGYESQLPTYSKAEKSSSSIYLVIRTKKTESAINRLMKIYYDHSNPKPDIIVIDGRLKPSASKKK